MLSEENAMIISIENNYQRGVFMTKISKETTVFDLIETYPKIKNILIELGLNGVENPLMLRTAGKKMTVFKGAKMKKISWADVVNKFQENGFIFEEEAE